MIANSFPRTNSSLYFAATPARSDGAVAMVAVAGKWCRSRRFTDLVWVRDPSVHHCFVSHSTTYLLCLSPLRLLRAVCLCVWVLCRRWPQSDAGRSVGPGLWRLQRLRRIASYWHWSSRSASSTSGMRLAPCELAQFGCSWQRRCIRHASGRRHHSAAVGSGGGVCSTGAVRQQHSECRQGLGIAARVIQLYINQFTPFHRWDPPRNPSWDPPRKCIQATATSPPCRYATPTSPHRAGPSPLCLVRAAWW
jgi:hypothetical protein